MRRESLKVLGIDVSRDFSARELLLLCSEELIDPKVAGVVSVLREFCEEFNEIPREELPVITCPADAVRVLSPHLRHLDHEECWVLLLNRANRVISKLRMSSGSTSACLLDVARIAKAALIAGAGGVLLAHNHPSGTPMPSRSDIQQTRKLREALNNFDISLIDHVIFSEASFYSFADERQESVGDQVE